MEKYYTPEIEELIPNIDIVLQGNEEKTNTLVSNYFIRVEEAGIYIAINLEQVYRNSIKNYRIKYLDKEDIESLGFKYYNSTKDWRGEIEHYKDGVAIDLQHIINNHDVEIYTDGDLLEKGLIATPSYLFRGVVKNKSEFKNLIKQLCITK